MAFNGIVFLKPLKTQTSHTNHQTITICSSTRGMVVSIPKHGIHNSKLHLFSEMEVRLFENNGVCVSRVGVDEVFNQS